MLARPHSSASRDGRPEVALASAHVLSSHGQSFSRAHFEVAALRRERAFTSRSRAPQRLAVAAHRARARILILRLLRLPRRSLAPTSAPSRWPPSAASTRDRRSVPAVLARPLQHLEVAGFRRRACAPRAAVFARPPGGGRPSPRTRTCPCPKEIPACAKPSTIRDLQLAAAALRRRSFFRTRRRRHLSVLRYPRSAASSSLNSSTLRPVASTASRMPLLTARRPARSLGSGSFAKTWVVTMSLRRPGIATRIATLACWVEVMVDDGAVVRVVVCASRERPRACCVSCAANPEP